MNTKQMEYVLELAKTKNFNRAAENLYISQPALTYQIKTVEDELGFKLFERSGKGVTITPAGEQFRVTVENVLAELKEAVAQGRAHENLFTKSITIGLPNRKALYYLPEAVMRFRESHPDIPISPQFYPPQPPQGYVRDHSDISAVLHESLRHVPNVREYPLFESRMFIVAPKDHPLAEKEVVCAEDLKGYPLLLLSIKFPVILHNLHVQILQKVHTQRFLMPDTGTILFSVQMGHGVALMPGFLNIRNDEFAWIPYDTPDRIPCSLVTAANERRQSVKEFVTLIQEVYREHDDPLL